MNVILLRLLFGALVLFYINACYAVPITGNIKGTVTLVEYYDYECQHCRRMEPVIAQLQAACPNLKIVHRVTPLLTSESRSIASFALAAEMQGHWQAIHQALMQSPTTPTLTNALQIAKNLGLNLQKILKIMQQPLIQQQLSENISLAKRHAIQGGIYLPILVFGRSQGKSPMVTLTGEQPYRLLAAIVNQLGDGHVQMGSSQKAFIQMQTTTKSNPKKAN